MPNSNWLTRFLRRKPARRAFVLSGGGALGALQVGALQALLDAQIKPDLLVGTSIGAANAVFLAVNGFSPAGLAALHVVWQHAAQANLLPANRLWLTQRIALNRAGVSAYHRRLRQFFINQGLSPGLRFGDLDIDLALVSTDLNAYRPLVYGADPEQLVLEGLMASTAIPPWVRPLRVREHYLMDGGAVSNLPIEAAMQRGAGEIYALDLFDPGAPAQNAYGFGPFLNKLMITVEQRQINLELALAQAKNVPVRHFELRAAEPVAIWDFSHTETLLSRGYQLAQAQLAPDSGEETV